MHYLITGGAGFIGSNIAEMLVQQSEKVRILDNFSTGKRENIAILRSMTGRKTTDPVEVIEGDIRDPDACKRAAQGVDYVLHHAAMVSVSQSVLEPMLCNAVNVTGTLNMLIAARDSRVRRFVLASSSAVYGDGDQESTPDISSTSPARREDMPAAPMTPYAVSKLIGENYCRIFHHLYGLETVCLRYFNVFGPRQDHMSEYAAVIPKFIDALRHGRRPVIYGDGGQSRDFIFVGDVVQANLRACVAPEAAVGKVFNVATHRAVTLLELLDVVKAILNRDLAPRFSASRPGDIRHSWADNGLAREFLAFSPSVSLRDGLARLIKSQE
jgi:UDP-N-acetylglucosamine 4-epimerase